MSRPKLDPRTIQPVQPLQRRNLPTDDESELRGIEIWVLAMIFVVVLLMSVGRVW